MSAQFIVGDLVWRLEVDPTPLNNALSQATSAAKKQEKEMGGVLGLLTSKWSIMAGVATGAAYAMIRASPSLSFAMEEVAYRFEYMIGIIGEEFAPLITDIVIPALDAMLPLVEEIAPQIGEAVSHIVAWFNDEDVKNYFSLLIDQLERIFNSLSTIVQPILEGFFNLVKELAPYLAVALWGALELIASTLEGVIGFVDWFADAFENVRNTLSGTGLIWVLEFLEGLLRGGVAGAITFILGHLDELGRKFTWLKDQIGEAIKGLKDFVEEGARSFGKPIAPIYSPASLGITTLGLATSMAMNPAATLGEVIVNITIPAINVSGDQDVTSLVDQISRELKRELGLLM